MLRRAYMRGNSAAIRSTNESDSASCILELHVRPGSESANYDRPRRFLYLVDSHTRTAALIGIRKNRQRFSQPEESSAPTRRTCERTIHLAVLLRPLRHHLFLLLLRELQMLLAEEPEPRSLRAVLAAWKSGSACLVSVHVRHRDQEQCRQPELVFIVDGAPSTITSPLGLSVACLQLGVLTMSGHTIWTQYRARAAAPSEQAADPAFDLAEQVSLQCRFEEFAFTRFGRVERAHAHQGILVSPAR